jgi:hypothetical protein
MMQNAKPFAKRATYYVFTTIPVTRREANVRLALSVEKQKDAGR